MGNSPAIFNGRRSKLLTADGILTSVGRTLDFDGPNNYIINNGAEIDALKWATYADAAASSPVDGTGGSPSSTFTRSTSSPLRGQASFLWTKSAANRQGEGFSYDFTIDAADKAKVLQISFDYLVSSGTYADSDMTIWIYDVTNAALIQPAGYTIQNASVSMRQLATFQSASNSTSYRLIVHTASTSASAYTLQFDNFSVGPQIVTNGAAVSDWTSYTPTFTGFGTAASVSFKSRRVGDSLEVNGKFTTGTNTATEARISVGYNGADSNVTIDTSKVPTGGIIGEATIQNASTTYFATAPLAPTANQSYINLGIQSSVSTSLTPANGNNFNSTMIFEVAFSVPIVGWSSNVQLSSDTDTRVVAMRAHISGASASVGANAVIPFNATLIDTHGTFNTSTYKYTTPVAGLYEIIVDFETASATNNLILINGAVYQRIGPSAAFGSCQALANLVAGTTIEVWSNNVGTISYTGTNQSTTFSVKRLSGPSVIAASESVSALYTGAPPTGTLTNAYNTTTFGTKVKDTHNAYSSGTYTVPVSGCYSISALASMSATYAAGSIASLGVYINGVQSHVGFLSLANATTGYLVPQVNVHSVPLLAGDLVTIRSYNDATTPTFASTASQNRFSIVRTGNY